MRVKYCKVCFVSHTNREHDLCDYHFEEEKAARKEEEAARKEEEAARKEEQTKEKAEADMSNAIDEFLRLDEEDRWRKVFEYLYVKD